MHFMVKENGKVRKVYPLQWQNRFTFSLATEGRAIFCLRLEIKRLGTRYGSFLLVSK